MLQAAAERRKEGRDEPGEFVDDGSGGEFLIL